MSQHAALPNEAVVSTSLGFNLYVDAEDERGVQLLQREGVLERTSLDLWIKALSLHPWDVVVDVGANYGEMIAGANLEQFSTVIAVEPNPRVTPYLLKTAGGLPWDVEVQDVALSARESEAEQLVVDTSWSGKSTLKTNAVVSAGADPFSTETVRVTTLDALLSDRGYTSACIKIDVEGEEVNVLAGASSVLDDFDIVVCMVEILHMPVQGIARLAKDFPFFLLNTDGGHLVRGTGTDPNELGRMLHDGMHSRQDALIIAGRNRSAMAADIRSSLSESDGPKRAVYTALMGNYEVLQEQPIVHESNTPFICFTDDPSLTSDTWDIRLIEPEFPLDPVRSARSVKVRPHKYLADFDETIWVDNRVRLVAKPETIFEELLADADMALFEHSFRDRVIDEFDAVVVGGYDDFNRVYEQLLHYAEVAPPVLDQKPVWTGFLVRRASKAMSQAMETWMDHVLRYSRRDQLSVSLALDVSGIVVNRLHGSNRESPYHEWPPINDALGRKKLGGRGFEASLRAPLARLRAIEREHVDLVEAQRVSALKRDEMLDRLRAKVADLESRAGATAVKEARLEEKLAKMKNEVERQRKISQRRAARLQEQSAELKKQRTMAKRRAALLERKDKKLKQQRRAIKQQSRPLATLRRRLAALRRRGRTALRRGRAPGA